MRSPITFNVRRGERIALLEFELARPLSPKDLKTISPPDPVRERFADRILIISGRGPIWLYGFLLEYYHPVKAVAFYDPRLNAGVVVASHTPSCEVGELVYVPEELWRA
ncbi:MAG: CRISPR-associated protein Csx3 [Thermotogae bacterium]|nr:CRISPR-associated protein Csx3 [Thermotogota bacterium]